MKILESKLAWLSFCLGTLAASSAPAAVVVNLPTATVDGKIQFTNDISFVITAPVFALTPLRVSLIVFDEWVVSDGSNSRFTTFSPSSFSYTLNGIPGTTLIAGLVDNWDMPAGDGPGVNDGFLSLNPGIVVNRTDVFTIKSFSYIIPAGSVPVSFVGGEAVFNPMAQQTFVGSAYLYDGQGGTLLGNPTFVGAVPEAGATSLFMLSGSLLFLRRRGLSGGR